MEGVVLNDEQRETIVTQFTSIVVLDAYPDHVVFRCVLNGSNDHPDVPEGAKRIVFGTVANMHIELGIFGLRLNPDTPTEDG